MQLPVFEHAYFLGSLGWAIACSFWQAGVLWLIYKLFISVNKNLPSVFKYNLSILLLFISFVWFIATALQRYTLLKGSPALSFIELNTQWAIQLQKLAGILPLFSLVYLALVCYYSLRFIQQYIRFNSGRSEALLKAPVDIRIFTNKVALHLGIKKKVQVWLSENVDVPAVTGFLKPAILLPVAIINQLTTGQAEAVLLHELAHIKRNDYLLNFVQTIVELVLFFNPFAVLLSNAAKEERENCCDDWVLNFQYDQHDYASALLILEDQRQQKLLLALAATNGKKNLLLRIKRLFKVTPEINTRPSQKLLLTAISMFLLAGGMLLPATIVKTITSSALSMNKKNSSTTAQKIAANNYAAGSKENSVATIINKPLLQTKTKPAKPLNLNKNPAGKPKKVEAVEDFTLALINEELLNKHIQANILPILVSDKEDPHKYFIQIEEEQSGKKQSKVYYFRLDNENGKTNVEPLLLLNKLTGKKATVKKLPQSLKPAKKRITS